MMPSFSLTFDPEAPHMTPIALAGLAALLVTMVTIWVFNAPGSAGKDVGAYHDQLARAGALLGRHHGDDPEAVRIGLTPSTGNDRRDALLFGPESDGTDMDGKPIRLSDYKGKVVVLVFWGTWCGPCMAMAPHEREVVARLKDQPFVLLGVDCKDDRETARKAMAREGMTWPSWYDGTVDHGPIAERYHVRTYPSIFVIDAQGIIRARHFHSVDQDLVDKLLDEMNRPGCIELDA
jgi:thiol-disulfide isomerase/thioredoxin